MRDSQCLGCKRYLGVFTCEAYPEKIPDPIFFNEVEHTEPFGGEEDPAALYDPEPGEPEHPLAPADGPGPVRPPGALVGSEDNRLGGRIPPTRLGESRAPEPRSIPDPRIPGPRNGTGAS